MKANPLHQTMGVSRAVDMYSPATSRGGAGAKLSKEASLFNGWKTGRGNHLERYEYGKTQPLPK